ncbi:MULTISPECIES: hypothetical protein [unclassified Caballeronia]|uniref:hypothetical protein n=1 Tax=unclassified Caballeronia TaxID=2646786 RepID=UPI002028192B|nr:MULTISPECIES: hypothetical protein [unclassified Caballeronia]
MSVLQFDYRQYRVNVALQSMSTPLGALDEHVREGFAALIDITPMAPELRCSFKWCFTNQGQLFASEEAAASTGVDESVRLIDCVIVKFADRISAVYH